MMSNSRYFAILCLCFYRRRKSYKILKMADNKVKVDVGEIVIRGFPCNTQRDLSVFQKIPSYYEALLSIFLSSNSS